MSEKAWFCYILKCADGSLYTGVTTEPERRTRQHNDGLGAKYTRARRPVKMIYCEPAQSQRHALRREHEIRTLSRARKLSLIRTTP
ncbi:MAG: GIY-YIG nuclease family protein [Gammaproteobacteria bacterium]|nr:GIY-YIG nuclease family protein [Gammaproteobacteria bacterium]